MIEEVIPVQKIKASNKKVLQGLVVSNKMDKSILVRVSRHMIHSLYKKRITRSKKFMAHDNDNRAMQGDVVQIIESRPHSKHKTWELATILERQR